MVKGVEKLRSRVGGNNTLETSGEDVKAHSKRVEKISCITLGLVDRFLLSSPPVLLFSLNRVDSVQVSQLGETWINLNHSGITVFTSFPLVSSVVFIFHTRFECSFHLLHSFRV